MQDARGIVNAFVILAWRYTASDAIEFVTELPETISGKIRRVELRERERERKAQPGEPHIIWRRLGGHEIFSRP